MLSKVYFVKRTMSARGPPKHSVSGGFAPYPPTRTGALPQTPDIGTSSNAHQSAPSNHCAGASPPVETLRRRCLFDRFSTFCPLSTISDYLFIDVWANFSHLNCFFCPPNISPPCSCPYRSTVCSNNSRVSCWECILRTITPLTKQCMNILYAHCAHSATIL